MDRKTVKLIVGVAAIVALLVAIGLLFVVLFAGLNTPSAIIMGIVSGLSLLLSLELGYMFLLNKSSTANYFLYDPATKQNVSLSKLTFNIVSVRTGRYLSQFAASEGKIWNEKVLDTAEVHPEFKPLVAYKLLYSLAEKDVDAGWNCLENASSKTIMFICEALNENSDFEFSNNFSKMMAEKPLNMPMIRDYLVRNKKYMQSRMFNYVKENIELF